MKTPTINLGIRQFGRDQSKSVHNLNFDRLKIKQKIKEIIKTSKKDLRSFINPYYIYKEPSKEFFKIMTKNIVKN